MSMSSGNYSLAEIKLNNYKSITNTKIKFNDGLNILIGYNGVGKTNIIESITNVMGL